MHQLQSLFEKIDSYIGGAQWFVFLLLGTGLFFTIYLKFPQFRYFRHALRITRGKYDKAHDVGDASHFQALATALSGTVGTGNIAGVALAVHLGGPAALFWMVISAFLGMTTKFVEVTLSHKYREKTADGTMAGGPMYYMKNKFNLRWLAAIFAVATIFCSFGTGSLPQINSIAKAMESTFNLPPYLTGGVLAIILAMVIVGGIKRIARVAARLVPAMALIYFVGAIAVIITNYENIIPSFLSIFRDVFTGTAATGGFLGAGFAFAFNRGVNRGLFSNEAGQGSAPIAHAAAKASEPVSEGMVAILEPFADTIIICMLTGLTLLASGVWNEKALNRFELADIQIIEGVYHQTDKNDFQAVRQHIAGKSDLPVFTGDLTVDNGLIVTPITIIHARSFADSVKVIAGQKPFTGVIRVNAGRPALNIESKDGATVSFSGYSLIHSAPLTTEAFRQSFFGDFGRYIVAIGLLLFAFSTAISWSYYGDRSVTFLLGNNYVIYYRLVYVVGFFTAALIDTSIVWAFSGITIALMALPNLLGILLLHKDMKQSVREYWQQFVAEYPDEKISRKMRKSPESEQRTGVKG